MFANARMHVSRCHPTISDIKNSMCVCECVCVCTSHDSKLRVLVRTC